MIYYVSIERTLKSKMTSSPRSIYSAKVINAVLLSGLIIIKKSSAHDVLQFRTVFTLTILRILMY